MDSTNEGINLVDNFIFQSSSIHVLHCFPIWTLSQVSETGKAIRKMGCGPVGVVPWKEVKEGKEGRPSISVVYQTG